MAQTLDTDSAYKITKSVSLSSEYNTKETEFGDGYRQIAIDGINYEKEVWSLEFVALDSTASLALETILKTSLNGTSNYLSWTPPRESTTKYWTAHGISSQSTEAADYWTVSCTLRREYPLV